MEPDRQDHATRRRSGVIRISIDYQVAGQD